MSDTDVEIEQTPLALRSDRMLTNGIPIFSFALLFLTLIDFIS